MGRLVSDGLLMVFQSRKSDRESQFACLFGKSPLPSYMSSMPIYILFYKPYGVLSQFTAESGHRSLKEFGPFPHTVYPVGRLDVDSEGLLLLTDDNHVKHRLTHPKFEHPRTYVAQVEGIPDEQRLQTLRSGVLIEGKKTRPARAHLLPADPGFPARAVPIRFRKNIPTCWLELTLTEGRNRQVRRMTAAIGHPTLRLIRSHIAFLSLEKLRPGDWRRLTGEEAKALQRIVQKHGEKEEAPF
jgi:23S rRNA pseudouridine2457 synthase